MRSNLVRAIVATVAGVMLVPLVGISSPAYAAVGAPALTSPASGATVTANPVLTWDRVIGAAKYEVQVASSSAFVAPLKFSSSTLNSRATPPADLATGSWWWRVRAFDFANVAGAYAVSTFSKVAANAPVVLTPVNSAVLQYPTDPLVFSWNPMAGIKTYEVQIDDDELFVGAPPPFSTNNTRYVPVSPPPFNMPFYWHVRGVSAQGVPTQWSEPRNYSMTWAILPPILTAPPSTNAVTIEEIVLDWQPVMGASAYELQVSPDVQFNDPIVLPKFGVVRATTFAPNPTLPAGAYFWRVRALSTSAVPEPGFWSEIRTFTRAWPAQLGVTRPRGTDGAGNGLLPQVQLILPANDDFTLSEPNFTWTPQREASNYQIEVGTDVNFSPGTFACNQTNHTAFTPYDKVLGPPPPGCPLIIPRPPPIMSIITPGRVLYWRVKALDGTVNGVYTRDVNPDSTILEARRFTVDPGFVTQTSPANGSTVNGAPVLRWNPVDNISRYKVTLDPIDATCPIVTAFTYNTAYVPEALKTTCVGPIQWTVQTVVSSGALGKIAIRSSWPTFTLGAQPSPGSSMDPIVLTDIDGDPSTPVVDLFTPPLMQWTPVTSATHYKVFASIAFANSYVLMNASTNWPAFAYTGENSTLGKLLAGDYDFYVEAYSSTNAVLGDSAVAHFNVTYNPPTLLSPANCRPADPCLPLFDTPTLDWTPVRSAGSYLVYLATDPNFTNITRIWTTSYSHLTPTESLPDSQAGQATYWFIRPCFAPGACAAFDPSVFPRAHAFRKTSAPIDGYATWFTRIQPNPPTQVPCTLLVPCSDEVTFTWKDYLATNYALVPKVTQEAHNYQVEVSTTAGFTNIIDTSPFVDQTTYTAQTITYPDGPLFWRVRAFDNTGNPLTYSQVTGTAFTKSSAKPVLTAPAAGSLQNGAPLLTWDPLPFTNTYAVEIYKNPSAPLSTANRVALITTRSTAAIPTGTLPKGDYGWRVQRIDVNSKAGPWTSIDNIGLRHFTVQGPAPALLSPVTGAKLEKDALLFQWAATAGASRYLVEASTSSAFTSIVESLTTDMTAWAPGQLSPAWPDSTIFWRVSSLDATGVRLATSAVWSVTTTAGSFTPLPTVRVFDGTANTTPRQVQIAGLGGVPKSATAVVVNTEVFAPTAAGYLRVTPAGLDAGVAVQEFARGQAISNLVVVKLVGGKIQVKVSAGSARILMDVSGYYGGTAGALFTPLPTARVFDGAATTVPRMVQIAGQGGVPADATAVVVNTEVFAPTAAGYVRVTPAGLDAGVAVQEFAKGQAISNLVAVKLVGGRIQVKVSAGSARILMDVSGYYGTTSGTLFNPLPTARVFDGAATTTPRMVQIAGLGGVPADATAVVVNTEVFAPTAAGYVRVTPAGLDPSVAVQQFAKGQMISNLVVVKLIGGKIQVKVSAGSGRILMDVSGYYGPAAQS